MYIYIIYIFVYIYIKRGNRITISQASLFEKNTYIIIMKKIIIKLKRYRDLEGF